LRSLKSKIFSTVLNTLFWEDNRQKKICCPGESCLRT
jgi:hypothetical protein